MISFRRSLRAASALALLALCCAAAPAQVTAVRAGRLVDPEKGTTLLNQIIVVEGRRVKAVGPARRS
ncbi:MAG: hypothetical protein M3416_19325 [Acidobacteriota bacterium]|nr:hypothetical protein [Acidobacteriota bacterium]